MVHLFIMTIITDGVNMFHVIIWSNNYVLPDWLRSNNLGKIERYVHMHVLSKWIWNMTFDFSNIEPKMNWDFSKLSYQFLFIISFWGSLNEISHLYSLSTIMQYNCKERVTAVMNWSSTWWIVVHVTKNPISRWPIMYTYRLVNYTLLVAGFDVSTLFSHIINKTPRLYPLSIRLAVYL